MDLQHLRASDGTGEAVLAHIQSVRNPGSTVLDLDNVDNWNSKAVVVTGTPNANGFIAAAGMKVMWGHLNAGDFIIDGFAPGYADNGNTTSEVAIVKMTTNWADALVDILKVAHNDDGTIKNDAITTKDQFVDALDPVLREDETLQDFVASGGIWSALAGLNAGMTALVAHVDGYRGAIAAVATRAFTASKDTYVDVLRTGTALSLVYTEVANGAAAPALAANSLRIAKVVTSGAAVTGVTQNSTSDSLGNILYNQNPLLGMMMPLLARQGGSATDAGAIGTNNYDTRGQKTFMQMGIFNKPTAGEDSVTFPIPFRYRPLIFVWVASANGANCWVRFKIASSSNTGIGGIQAFNTAGANVSNEYIGWLAIGV